MTGSTTWPAKARPVVVGVDGSRHSWRALHAGAREARVRRVTLVLAHGYPDTYPYFSYGWTPPLAAIGYDIAKDAAAVLEEMVSRARSRYPDLSIDSVLRPGSGGKVIEASHNAALVVVGTRGHGGFGGLSIGSVAAQTAAHAASPVMVIRPTNDNGDEQADITEPDIKVPHPGPVIVGVDGSSHQDATLEYAFQAAAVRGVPLVAVNVWWQLPEDNLGPDVPGRYNMAEAQDEARRLLAEMTAGWSSQFPDVPLEQQPMQSMNPSYTLIQASQAAGLVVVGSRGRGGFAGLLLGSVGRDLIGHAYSPVVVVHPAASARP